MLVGSKCQTLKPDRVRLAALCLLFGVAHAAAQDDFFSTVNVEIPNSLQSRSSSTYSLFGWINQKIGYGLEAPGAPFSRQDSELSKVETSLFAQFDTPVNEHFNLRISGKAYRDSIYALSDDPEFSKDERNKFRSRFEVKDFFIERQFDNGAYLKIGNQLFAWGLAEYLRVTDLVNTEDQFTFGQQDLEDIRLQVPAALLSVSLGNWTLDSAVTYQAGKNDTAPERDEFDQFLRLRDAPVTLAREHPDNQSEIFFRASTHYSSGDIQVVAGEFNDNDLTLARIDGIKSIRPQLVFSQNRMRAVGAAANRVMGSWLLFGEIALHQNKAIRPVEEAAFEHSQGWAKRDQLLSAIGIEYNGLRNAVLSFEIDNTHISSHDGLMMEAADETSVATRLLWNTFNERLEIVAVFNALIDADTQVGRLSANYNWSDRLNFGLLWMNYSSARDSIFYDYRNNDLFQLQLQYNFQF